MTASVSPPPLSEAGPSLPSEARGGLFAAGSAAYVEPARRLTLNGWATIAVFLPPALLLFTVFVALPMAEAAWYGFYNWDGYGRPEKFIGLKNYGYLIGNATFARSLINNGLIIAVSLLVQLPLALAIALMVAGRIPGAAWFRMIFFLPYVLADVAAGLIWHFMFDGDYGLVGAATDRARHAALLPARGQNVGVLGRADRHRVEVFRFPHDALCRRAAGH